MNTYFQYIFLVHVVRWLTLRAEGGLNKISRIGILRHQWSASQYMCSLYFDQIFCFPDNHHRYQNFDPHHQKCLNVYTLSAGRLYHSAFADMGSSFICIAALSTFLAQETQHKIVQTPFLESITTTKWKNRFENVGIGPFPPCLHGCL